MVTANLSKGVKNFLQQPTPKVLLLRSAATQNLTDIIFVQIAQARMTAHYIDCEKHTNMEDIFSTMAVDAIHVFIFNSSRLENYYEKFQLGRWQAKAIIICNDTLLHPTLDPSIYFAPLKKNTIQRHLLIQLTLAHPQWARPASFTENHLPADALVADNLLNAHFLNKKLMTNDIIMMQMLADRVTRDEIFKTFLFQLVYASRNDSQLKIAAANAITALNYARIAFSELDFSRVQIPYADLSNAICHHTSFIRANLQAVKLHNVFLGNADLSGAEMYEVDFGQLPNIRFTHKITAMAMTMDKKTLVLGNAAGDLIVYDAENLKEKCTLVKDTFWQGRTNKVEGISLNADGTLIAALRKDSYIYVWDATTQKILKTFHYASDPLFFGNNSYFCLSPNGKYLAFYYVTTATLKVYNLHTGNTLTQPPTFFWHHEYDNTWHHAKMAFSLESDALYFLVKTNIYVWRCRNETLTFAADIAGHRATGFTLSPHGKWIIVSFEDRLVQYETATHKVLNVIPTKNAKNCHFDKNCETVFALSKTSIYNWNLAVNTIEESNIGISDIELSEVSSTGYFLTVKENAKNALQIQSLFYEYHQINPVLLQTLKPFPFGPKHWKSVLNLGQKFGIPWTLLEKSIISNDQKTFAVCDNKILKIYDLYSAQLVMSDARLSKETAKYSMVFSHDDKFIICYGFSGLEHGIYVRNILDAKVKYYINERKDQFLAISDDSNSLCYVGDDEAIMLVIFDKGFNKIRLGNHKAYVHYGAFLSKNILLTCDESGVIKFWNLLTLACHKEIKIPYRHTFEGRQTIVSECYALNTDKTLFAFGYVELVSKLDFEAKIAVIDCIDSSLIRIKNLQTDDGFTSTSQIVFDETNGLVFARVNNAIAMFTIDQWQLLYSLNIFTQSFTIKSIKNDKLSIELSNGELYELLIKQGRENYLLLSKTSAKSPLYLKNAVISDTTVISATNTFLIQQQGGCVPKEQIMAPITQEPAQQKCRMM